MSQMLLFLTSQAAFTTRVDAIDVTMKRHSERLDVVKGQLCADTAGRNDPPPRASPPRPAQRSYADAASSSEAHNNAQSNRPAPKVAPGPTASTPAQTAQALRIEFLGLHDFVRRYEDALHAAQACEFLTKVDEGFHQLCILYLLI